MKLKTNETFKTVTIEVEIVIQTSQAYKYK